AFLWLWPTCLRPQLLTRPGFATGLRRRGWMERNQARASDSRRESQRELHQAAIRDCGEQPESGWFYFCRRLPAHPGAWHSLHRAVIRDSGLEHYEGLDGIGRRRPDHADVQAAEPVPQRTGHVLE